MQPRLPTAESLRQLRFFRWPTSPIRHALLSLLAAISFGIAHVPAEAADRYQITDLGPGFATGINDLGQVTGSLDVTGTSASKAYIWDGGLMTLPSLPGELPSRGFKINRGGEVVGASGGLDVRWNGNGVTAFRTLTGGQDYSVISASDINDAGIIVGQGESIVGQGQSARLTFTPLLISSSGIAALPLRQNLPSSYNVAMAINNAGVVVGADGSTAVMWVNGSALPTQLPSNGMSAMAFAINERNDIAGNVVGLFNGSHQMRSVIWINGEQLVITDPLAGMATNQVWGINDAQQIVGTSSANFGPRPEGNTRAFLWEAGQTYDLTSLIPADSGWSKLSYAWDINNKGQIVGSGVAADGQLHGFLLTPVPEPPQLTLLLLGMGIVAGVVARRSHQVHNRA